MEKLESILQQQKAQAPVPQTIEPVRQPRGIYSKEDLDLKYTEKPFQRSRPQQKDNSRLEEKVDEIGNMLSHLNINNQFQKPVAKSNRTQRYYPFQPINLTYNELFPKLSPVMRKMYQSHTVQKEKSDKWFSYLQYLNTKIDNMPIFNSFLDPESKFGILNDVTINALGWKANKPSNFDIKDNSKHITEILGWFINVPVSIIDKDGKTVTSIENFTHIDDGEPEPMLCLGMSWIRKVQ
ncbi:4202_t:CDS:2, partial [Diversispora eburnea]